MKYDIIIVGGGLSGCLLASRLVSLGTRSSVLLIEKDSVLGGKHTWSFHETDIPESAKDWFLPLASKIWSSHSVAFPRFKRDLQGAYGSIRSHDFHEKIIKDPTIQFLLGKDVVVLKEKSVHLNDGTCIEADAVIDARGFTVLDPAANAYQKFFGLNVKLKRPHGLKAPVLMDATVEQIDGYRFMYLLPWSDTEILLEDTYYSESLNLPVDAIRERIHQYIRSKGWELGEVQEEEVGVLPIPLYEEFTKGEIPYMPSIGVRAGLFNRTTGFSLPVVLQLIEEMVKDTSDFSRTVSEFLKKKDAQQRKFCFLNRVLFSGTEPHLRYRVLEQFYELPEPLIAKFYATRMGLLDWGRFFSRRPPVPIRKALQSGFKQRVLAHV